MTSSPTRSTRLSNFRVSSFTNPVALSTLAEDSLRTLSGAAAVADRAAAPIRRGCFLRRLSDAVNSGSVGVGGTGGGRLPGTGDGRGISVQRGSHALPERPGRDHDGIAGLHALELGADFVRELLERVPAGENELNDRRGDTQLGAARRIEERLQVVRQVPQRVQVKKTGAALQGVEGAKDGVDRIGIRGVLLQHQHALLDVLQQFLGFAVEFAEQLGIFRQVQADARVIRDRLPGRRFGGSRSRVCDRCRQGPAGGLVPRHRSRRHFPAPLPRRKHGTHPGMPIIQEPDGVIGECSRAVQDLIQQRSDCSQAGCKDCRCALAGEFLEVHDQAVNRQETGILTRLDES